MHKILPILQTSGFTSPSMTGNGRQQTRHCAFIAVVLYSRLSRLVSDTRSVQMLRAGHVLCRALVIIVMFHTSLVHSPFNLEHAYASPCSSPTWNYNLECLTASEAF